jgi:hypothetical protein
MKVVHLYDVIFCLVGWPETSNRARGNQLPLLLLLCDDAIHQITIITARSRA